MSNITVRIKLREHIEDESFTLSTDDIDKVSNIGLKPTSDGVFNDRVSNLQGAEVLSLSNGLIFDKDGILKNFDLQNGYLQSEQGPSEYVFGATDENGYYSVELTISGECVNGLSSFVIYGDKLANQFPTEATIDGVPFYSDDYKLVIPLDTTKLSHTINLIRWNRPNYNACLTVIIATMEYLTYTNTEIDSLKSLERSTTNGSEINYGTIANSGLIELIDEDEEIKDLVNDGILPNSNVPIDILFNDKVLQNHISNDTNYDTAQGMFSLSLSNKMEMLDKLKYQGFPYPDTSMSLYEIFYLVMNSLDSNISLTDDIDSMMQRKCITPDGEKPIYEYLKDIIIEYPVIEYGYTYRQVLDDICKLAQLNMFINKNNEYELMSARPLLLGGETKDALRIIRDALKEEPNYDLIMKNQYDAIEISENIVNDAIDYDKLVYSENKDLYETNLNNYNITNIKTSYNQYQGSYTSNNILYVISSFIKTEYFYYAETITISKLQNNNLIKILDINNWDNGEYNYSIIYLKKSANATNAVLHWNKDGGIVTLKTQPIISELSSGEQIRENGLVYDIFDYSYTITDGSITYTKDIPCQTIADEPIITITSDDNNYYIQIQIPIGKKILNLGGYSTTTGTYFPASTDIPSSGEYYEYLPLQLNISFYGNQRIISFDNVSVSSPNVNDSKTVANFGNTTTKLLQDKCLYNNQKISEVIKSNILSDYRYGISNLKLDMFTTDLKNKDGKVIKKIKDGDVLDIGDVIFLTNDKDKTNQQRYWSVYDNEYLYDGSVDESVQASQKREYYGLYNDKYFFGWQHLINNGDIEITESNGIIKLNVINKNLSGELFVDNSINIIDNYCFNNCENLTKIILGNNITEIGNYAFQNCTNLTNIIIPNSIEKIGQGLFNNCENLIYNTYNNANYLGNNQNEHLILVSLIDNTQPMISINNNTKFIYGRAFISSEALKIEIPDTLNSIDNLAFFDCINLKNIYIPSNVNYIAGDSFLSCDPSLVIYCGVNSKPDNWSYSWNYTGIGGQYTTKWGYTREEYNQEIKNT